MYENPINVYVQEIINNIESERENAIAAKISESIGVDVDKDELIKALQYDRNQYNKGYADAKARYESMLYEIRAEIERRGGNDEKAFCKNLNESFKLGLREAIGIIDNYREEQTDADSD